MSQYIIRGGKKLHGNVKISGNKNAALPCIAAAILSDEPVILRNVPHIEDVFVLTEILRSLGGRVHSEPSRGEMHIHMPTIKKHEIDRNLSEKIRASVLLAGPMLARSGKIILPPPGGDIIGRRRLDSHFQALRGLGADVTIDENDEHFIFQTDDLHGEDIFLDEASVTATENAIMAAALAEGSTILRNAASEPHVQDLCTMINSMGGDISGIGSNILTIRGVKKLHGTEFTIGSDYMEIGSYIGLAAVTGSALRINNIEPRHLRMISMGFAKLGIGWETDHSSMYVPDTQLMKVQPDSGGAVSKIDDAPWPGFPPDLLSIILTVATQVSGTILIHEKMYESRMFFVDKLIHMGAHIVLCDPHRAVVSGASPLQGTRLVSPDVRAGMALVIAALAARGESRIQNIYQIERGYENPVEKLRNIGADIQKTD